MSNDKLNSLPKMTYREFCSFMTRYNKQYGHKNKKEIHESPYKYKRVFNKDRKNES